MPMAFKVGGRVEICNVRKILTLKIPVRIQTAAAQAAYRRRCLRGKPLVNHFYIIVVQFLQKAVFRTALAVKGNRAIILHGVLRRPH